MKTNFFKIISTLSVLSFYPISASAQFYNQCYGLDGLAKVLCKLSSVLNSVIPVLVALGVVYFVWGVVQYVIGDSEEAKTKGRDRIIFGVIGLAVIIGIWGLVYILADTFDLDSDTAPPLDNLLPQYQN